MREIPGRGYPVQDAPFCDWRRVDAGAGGYGGGRVLDSGMDDEMVDSGRDEMDELNAIKQSH